MRMSFTDLLTKNTFILLCMQWATSEKKLSKKTTEIFLLECLPRQLTAGQPLERRQKSTVLQEADGKAQQSEA